MVKLTKTLALIVLIVAAQVCVAQSIREERKVSAYEAVSVATGIDLYIRQGARQQVIVETEEEDLKDLVTKVSGGELDIYFENSSFFWNWKSRDAKVYVTVTNIKSIKSSSGADVVGETVVTSNELGLETSSGAGMKLQIRAKKLIADTSSGSKIELLGETEVFEGHSSSGSDLDARGLVAKKAKVHASSGSDLSITATEEIDADASSGSDISYSGKPQYVNIDESSGGDVSRRNF